jgi:phosphomannomutase
MSLSFGTSGVRGLVTEMTDLECYLYGKAFAQHLQQTGATTVCLAGDFRSSTPRIMQAVAYAIQEAGLILDYVGYAPTPTLALHSMACGAGAIMVTGSHIPDDRNGIKFYMPAGEILKRDEQAISQAYLALKTDSVGAAFNAAGMLQAGIELGEANPKARTDYIQRYTDLLPPDCLSGLKIVCYQHSTVGRTLMPEILEALGATVPLVGWSDSFVPVDTEAVANPAELAAWVAAHNADALISADGDCDRPLLVDEMGKIIRGDILGILAAGFLGADSVATPVSCNTALELSQQFPNISRTRIGSPYVIAAMNEAVAAGHRCVIGYEANGGFLTGSDIQHPACSGTLTALPTRDAMLPLLCALLAARAADGPLSQLTAKLPPRFTVGGIIRDFPTAIGQTIVSSLSEAGIERVNELLAPTFGTCTTLDLTDGCRMTFTDGTILHFRPSGNAPEFRVYTESDTEALATQRNEQGRRLVVDTLKPAFT